MFLFMVSGLFRFLVAYACASQVWSQRFWMLHYKSRSPKRTRLWSCSTAIRLFDLGPMTKQTLKAGTKVKTTKKTISKSGRQQFTGSADLRGTQSWPQLMDMHACMYPEAQYHSFINSYLHACMHACMLRTYTFHFSRQIIRLRPRLLCPQNLSPHPAPCNARVHAYMHMRT